jgi:rubredoxin
MRCKICGHVFDESKKPETCKGCLGSCCNMIKCPNCGFETLPESKREFKLLNLLKRRIKNENK